ncbi:MAG: gliding motility-associated C-terminal domain-containing protein [Ferruginibacter sp.]
MRKLLLAILILMIAPGVQSQTFTGAGGAIPDAGGVVYFPVNVTGVGAIDAHYGLASVCLSVNHPFDSDLEIFLKAPDGNTVQLSIQNGANGANYTNTCFTANAMVPISSGTAPFSGTYLPQGYLGNVNNGQGADGTWNLCIEDKNAKDMGSLLNWSLTFNSTPAPPPPVCTSNPAPGNTCATATPVCNFNGFCGNTSLSYTADTWPELSAAFCGVIENNSFVSFTASSSSISFNVWVTNSLNGDGIEMMVFSGGCGSGPVQKYACNTGIIPSATGPTLLSVAGLIPGNTYYIMIDGKNADVCDYILVAASGINTLNVTQSKPVICQGQKLTLSASGGNGVYSWSPAEGLSDTTGSTVTASPDTSITYIVSSTPSGNCVLTTEVIVKVNPKPDLGADQFVSICPTGSVDLTKKYPVAAGLTKKWTLNGAPVSNPAAVSAAGNYRLIVTNSAGCADTAFVTIMVNLKPNIGMDKQMNMCQGDSLDISTQFNTLGLVSSWSFGGLPVPDTTKVYIPGVYRLIASDGSFNSVCTDTALLTVKELVRPNLGVDKSGLTCQNQMVNLKTQFNTTGLTQEWTMNGTLLSSTNVNIPGTYQVEVTDTEGCTDTALYVLNIKPKPRPGNSKEVKVCPGIAVNLNSFFDTTGLVMDWQFGGIPVANPYEVTAAGVYTLLATNSFGCSTGGITLTVIIDSKLNLGSDRVFDRCPGAPSIDLTTLFSTIGLTTSWEYNGVPFLTPKTASNDGDYILFADNGAGCADTIAVKIYNRPKPDIGADTGVTFCSNSEMNLYKIYDTTGYSSVLWFSQGIVVSNPDRVAVPGGYAFIVKTVYGCADTAVATLIERPNLALGNDTSAGFCAGSSIDLATLYPSYFSNKWSLNGVPVVDPSKANAGGIYQLIASHVTGCSDTAFVTVTQNLKPALGIDKSITICPGSTLGLTAQYNTSGLSTEWSSGGVAVINPSSINKNGLYRLIAINNLGCADTAQVSVTIKPKPDLGADKKMPKCIVKNVDLTAEYNTAGLVTSWSFNNVPIPPPVAVNMDGVYQLVATNSAGCSDTVLLSVILNPKPSLKTDTVVSICAGTSLNLEQLFDTTGLTSLWTFKSLLVASPSAVTDSGQYILQATNPDGCSDTGFVQVNLKPVSASNTAVTVCSNQLPYVWNGYSCPTAGNYTVNLVNAVGCDSAAMLALTVNDTSFSTTNVAVCSNQLPYSWNGNNYNATGIYKTVLVNTAGCDSVAFLNFTVNDTSVSTTLVTVCSNQLPYTWNGNNYTATGIYKMVLPNIAGCDSVAILNFTVNDTSFSTTVITVCSNQLPYSWNGNSYTSAGLYKVVLQNLSGCDSVAILGLNVNDTSASVTNAMTCSNQLPYVWNGNSYTATGAYKFVLQNSFGCDSVAVLNLVVYDTSASKTDVTVCSNQLPYIWNSNSYSSSGSYKVTLSNGAGCDFVATLNLLVSDTSKSSTDVTVCSNQLPYSWNGNQYTATGVYNVVLKNSAGCDSVAVLNLLVNDTSTSTTIVTVCSNQLPYPWNGNQYTATGIYNALLQNSSGCDSVAVLNLQVNDTSKSATPVIVCSNQLPYLWNGNSYATAGTYTVVLKNNYGCDSAAVLMLTVHDTSTSTTNVTICSNQMPYVWNSNSYTAGGVYKVTLSNVFGCDSVAVLNLVVNDTSTRTASITVCSNQLPYTWNGSSYTATGRYSVKLANAAGCDSVAVLQLTVNNTSSSNTDIAVCENEVPYIWNGQNCSLPGKYTATLVNAAGCDSIATLNFIVNILNSSTTTVNTCSRKFPYQWNGNSYPLPGTYTVTLKNYTGCDSSATLKLVQTKTDTSITNTSICKAALPFSWNNKTYTAAGKYFADLVTAGGCDSVATLLLTVNDSTVSTTDVDICTGYLPYQWNGLSLNTAGSYRVILKNRFDCDSVAKLNLKVSISTSSSESKTICNNDLPYIWRGVEYPFPGTYSETYVNAVGCDSVATFTLIVKTMPVKPNLGEDMVICRNDKLVLDPGNYDNYLWQDNSKSTVYNVESSGVYTVTVWSDSNCIISDSIYVQVLDHCGELFFPNAFTPDGDGRNDKFGPGPAEYFPFIKEYHFQVFNRYGAVVFATTDINQRWDGTQQGKALSNGAYVWVATYLYKGKMRKVQKGSIVLMR